MSQITSCPKCAQQVTVPGGANPVDSVRCPLCQSEYSLQEALDKAPPMLLLVRSLSVVGPEASHSAADEATDLHLFGQPSDHAADVPPMADTDDDEIELALDTPEMDDSGEPATIEIDRSAAEEPPAFELSPPTGSESPALNDSDDDAFDFAQRDTELDDLGVGSAGAAAEHESAEHLSIDDLALDSRAHDSNAAGVGPALASFDESPFEEDESVPSYTAFGDAPTADATDEGLTFEPAAAGGDEEIGLEPRAGSEQTFGFSEAASMDAGGAPALTTTPRRERRKPSMLAGLIIWSTSLPVAAVLAYAILLWGFKTDPVGLAPKLPKFMVPASIQQVNAPAHSTTNASNTAPQQIARAPQEAADQPGFQTNVPEWKPREGDKPAQTLPFATEGTDDETGAAGGNQSATDDSATASTEPTDATDDATESMDTADPSEITDTPESTDLAADSSDAETTANSNDNISDDAADDTSVAGTGADDSSGAGMDEEPADTDVAADTTNDAPGEKVSASTDDSTDNVADSTDVPGSDLTAPEPAETVAQVGPRDDVHYSADDLNRALKDIRGAGKSLAAADKESAKKLKAAYYRKLYQLAEVATFANAQAGPDHDQIYQVLADAAADKARFGELGKAAGKWLTAAKGKEHQGIVLSGSVQDSVKKGDVFETHVLLSDGAQTVIVLSPQKLPLADNDPVVVLGSIVSDPGKNIAGYAGDQPTAIWSGLVMKAPSGG